MFKQALKLYINGFLTRKSSYEVSVTFLLAPHIDPGAFKLVNFSHNLDAPCIWHVLVPFPDQIEGNGEDVSEDIWLPFLGMQSVVQRAQQPSPGGDHQKDVTP